MNEIISLIILIIITLFFLILSELLAAKGVISKSLARKLLHISSGFIVVCVPFIIDSYFLVILVGLGFSVNNYYLIKKRILKQIENATSGNLGIFYYPLAFLITVVLFWKVNKFLISLSFLIFSICDAIAAITGSNSKEKFFIRATKEPKTYNGTIAFILSSFILIWIAKFTIWDKFNFVEYDFWSFAFIALIYSLIGGITELLSTKGTDNLSLPIILSTAGMVFYVVGIEVNEFLVAFVLAISISIISFKLKFLDLGGSVLTFLIALFIYGIGGWKWTIPILAFFIFSTLLSKIAEKFAGKEVNQIFEKGSRRDYKQVLANGGIALLISILSVLIPAEVDWYLLYILAIAISTSDTWSTEFGTLFAKNVYLITSLKKVEKGISGGISLIGFVGGVLGSLVIVSSALMFVYLRVDQILQLVVFATIGNIFDSLMGASVQVIYSCKKCNKLTEKLNHCGEETVYFKGISFVDNDIVNLSSVLFVSIVYFIFLMV